MRDVFISHADEDAPIALAIARGLNAAGYTTWCYESDSDPGPSYLSQIDEELEATQAVVLIISPSSLASRQVSKEVVRAHEAGKPFIPLRRGVDHETVQHQRDWRMALGASVSIALPDDGIENILPRVIRGLERTGVRRAGVEGPLDSSAARVPGASASAAGMGMAIGAIPAPVMKAIADRVVRSVDRVSEPTRIGITTVVGVLGVIGSFGNVMTVMNPEGATAALYRTVPTIGTANLVANSIGLGLNLALLFSVWQLYAQRAQVSPRIRLITSLMLIAIIVWFVVVVFATFGGRLRGDARLSVIGTSVLAVVLAGAPAAVVRMLFRR